MKKIFLIALLISIFTCAVFAENQDLAIEKNTIRAIHSLFHAIIIF